MSNDTSALNYGYQGGLQTYDLLTRRNAGSLYSRAINASSEDMFEIGRSLTDDGDERIPTLNIWKPIYAAQMGPVPSGVNVVASPTGLLGYEAGSLDFTAPDLVQYTIGTNAITTTFEQFTHAYTWPAPDLGSQNHRKGGLSTSKVLQQFMGEKEFLATYDRYGNEINYDVRSMQAIMAAAIGNLSARVRALEL